MNTADEQFTTWPIDILGMFLERDPDDDFVQKTKVFFFAITKICVQNSVKNYHVLFVTWAVLVPVKGDGTEKKFENG